MDLFLMIIGRSKYYVQLKYLDFWLIYANLHSIRLLLSCLIYRQLIHRDR
jgi:hypothetical protein